jgi:hypothetical protein
VWWCIAAAWAGKWDGVDSNVTSTATIAAPPADVYGRIDDWNGLRAIFDAECVNDWIVGDQAEGIGAEARMTYHNAMMHRRLTAKVAKLVPDRYVDLEHLGNKGFVTRFELKPAGEGATEVTMTTYTNPPPWPFKAYYFKRVKPAWTTCQDRALANLAKGPR